MSIDLADPEWISVIIAILLAIIGATFTLTKMLVSKKGSNSRAEVEQKQISGDYSENFQAGRNLNIHK